MNDSFWLGAQPLSGAGCAPARRDRAAEFATRAVAHWHISPERTARIGGLLLSKDVSRIHLLTGLPETIFVR